MEERDLRVIAHRYTKDAYGRPVNRRVQVKPRRAYWNDDGEWPLECRNKNRPMELLPGKFTILACSCLQQVADMLSTIRRAVENGAPDQSLAVAVEKARRKSVL
jgi:hypothetical protein